MNLSRYVVTNAAGRFFVNVPFGIFLPLLFRICPMLGELQMGLSQNYFKMGSTLELAFSLLCN